MFLFDYLQKMYKGKIVVPYQMRAVLHLHEESRVSITSRVGSPSSFQNQLIITPFPPEQRVDLWNLKVSFRDRPGLIAEISKILSERDIQIVEFATLTRNQNNEAVMDINFDARNYVGEFDGSVEVRKKNPGKWLVELYSVIVSHFIEDIIFRPDGKPHIYLRRNDPLRESTINVKFQQSSVMRNGSISIPREIIREIRESFMNKYPLVKERTTPYAALAADPEQRAIWITIFFPNTGYIHLRIKSQYQTSVLARVTETLFEHGLNIEYLTTRTIFRKSPALKVDILLHLPTDKDTKKNDKDLKKWISAIFRGSRLRDLNCSVSFPNPVSVKALLEGGSHD